jgi:hypothetical protein
MLMLVARPTYKSEITRNSFLLHSLNLRRLELHSSQHLKFVSWNTRESRDGKFRVLNKRAGKLLWETDLPAFGFATPATYEINGRQYIVIACGSGKWGTKSGDSYVAFALPH